MANDAAESVRGRARPIPFARVEICDEARQAAARVLDSGWVTTGPEVLAFEGELAEWVGAGNAVAVASCTAAIELSLRALGLPPGANVLTSTMTFCGAVHAIVHAGLVPVLADIDPVTLCSDASACAAAARRAGGVDAMVVTHYAGYPAPVAELAEAAGLPLQRVVEDAAHALGTEIGSRPVGTVSAATCFSFYATKNLPIGEGGMVTTDDQAIADHVRRTRLHGMSKDAWKRYLPGSAWRYSVEVAGLKANMTDLQAAIGRAQLRRFGGWQGRRDLLASRYDEGLAGIPGLRLPARSQPQLPLEPARGGSAMSARIPAWPSDRTSRTSGAAAADGLPPQPLPPRVKVLHVITKFWAGAGGNTLLTVLGAEPSR